MDSYLEVRQNNIERNKKFLNDIGFSNINEDVSLPKKKPKQKHEKIQSINIYSRRSSRIAELSEVSYKVVLIYIAYPG